MDAFRRMVNECIRIGLESGASSLKRLSLLSYSGLKANHSLVPSYYRSTAIFKAAGILVARKKSLRRCIQTKNPYARRPFLVSCYRFKIENGQLVFPITSGKRFRVQLNKHTLNAIKVFEVRSFTLTPSSLSLTFRKSVEPYIPKSFAGVDRNASNVTYGNQARVLQFSLAKVEEIARTTEDIIQSSKRNDGRIRRQITSNYGKRRKERTNQILHRVSTNVVEDAYGNETALVFEDIKDIRNLYKKGKFQGKNSRARMNSVPWYEIKRKIEYKPAWEGVPITQPSEGETSGTSRICPVCGARLQEDRYNRVHRRELWCERCKRWSDRDVIAVMNIAYRGWLRIGQSSTVKKGEAGEAMVQEPHSKEGAILKVDASKLTASVVLYGRVDRTIICRLEALAF